MIFTEFFLSFLVCSVTLSFLVGAVLIKPTTPSASAIAFKSACIAAVGGLSALLIAILPGSVELVGWLAGKPVNFTLLLLVVFMSVVLTRFSANYLSGEPKEADYYRTLLLTLAMVSLVIIANHLLLMLAAWTCISFGFHRLMMFYPGRPRAALAAHKKFLFARLAELFFLGAAFCLYLVHGTWWIDEIVAAYPKSLTSLDQLAALCLAIAALIKCAQLPVHGWLIQVVEAPTPISALLHAGIINLGGFVLITFAPLISLVPAAKWLLFIVAGLTVLLAGLIMLTRVSIKVRLAWSTTAQMGLMLIECALGLYELALLHLVAHSCYKSYAFLSSGSNVEHTMQKQLLPLVQPTLARWLLALGVSFLIVAVPVTVFGFAQVYSPWVLLVGLLTLVLTQQRYPQSLAQVLPAFGLAVILVAIYSAQKFGATWLVPNVEASTVLVADLWFCLLIGLLFAGYIVLTYARETTVSKRLWHVLFAGLYLDEWATRVTLAVWPARIPISLNAKRKQSSQFKQESLI